jgi:hypothetical protein
MNLECVEFGVRRQRRRFGFSFHFRAARIQSGVALMQSGVVLIQGGVALRLPPHSK